MKKLTLMERMQIAAKKQESGENSNSSSNQKYKSALPIYEFKLTKRGDTRALIRVVPYTVTDPRGNPDNELVGEHWYKRRYWAHFVGGTHVVCLRSFGIRTCPVCEKRIQLYQAGDAENAKEFNCRERELYNVYDYSDNKMKLLDSSTYFFGEALLRESNDPDNEGAIHFVDPGKDGRNLSIRFDVRSTFNGREFPGLGAVSFPAAKGAIPDEVLEQALDLDAILIETSAEELARLVEANPPKARTEKPAEDANDAPAMVTSQPKKGAATKEAVQEDAPPAMTADDVDDFDDF